MTAIPPGYDHGIQPSTSSIVRIDPAVVQNIEQAHERPCEQRLMASEIRLDGKVIADESRVRSVTARVSGYVEKLNASVSGQSVRQGESLLELYSPDLVSAQQELLEALRYRDALPDDSPLAGNAEDLVESARHRLMNWGTGETFVAGLEKTRRVERLVPISSPITGVLTRKNVVAGQSVAPGAELFQIEDLSEVWITARVYQQDLTGLRIGLPATLRFRNLPGRDFTAPVFFIAPEMDSVTRTAEIRLRLRNTSGMDLRPEMFAEVLLHGHADSVLAIPEQAVIHSGTRELAVISLGEGRFEPREIHIGRTDDGYVEVLDGLSKDETIVVSAQFLIDSESNLRAAIEQMQAGAENSGNRTMADTTGDKHAH